jgi:hypothetical protein
MTETSSSKKIDIVIAHYDEDLSWLDQVDKTYVGEIFIYNKKGDTQYRTLPNIGQDPHTFLTHIIENYNNLSDGLVFLQGNPFSNGDNTVLPNNVGDINFFLQELQTRKNTTNYKKGQQDFGLYEGKLQYWNNRRLIDSGTNFYDWFYDVFGENAGNGLIFWGCQLGVSREVIQYRDLNFYQNLIKYFGNDEGVYEMAHFIERSFAQIFNIKVEDKIALIQVWLGPIPEYFKYHFETIKNLDYIDFLFFTDQEVEEESDSFKKIYIDKDKIEQLIKTKTGQSVSILNNKKVCDLKASFGHLFEDYLSNYSNYGVYDIDTLFGDVDKFVSEHLFNYDFISFGSENIFNRLSGPFLIFKNTEKVKKSYLCDYFFEMMKNPEVTCFEENYFFENIVKQNFSYKILKNVCNFIEKEGCFANYYTEWDNGILTMNGNEIMLFHFYHKNMVDFQMKDNKIISNFKKKYTEDFYWVTYLSENYQTLVENLLDSLRKYSNRKLIAYTINYDVSQEFLDKWANDQFIFIRYDIEEGHKDERGRDFNILSLKPKICLDTLTKYKDCKFVYLDTDVYVTVNIDNVRYYFESLEDYPLFNSHIHDYILASNEKTDWEWVNSISQLLRELNIKQNPILPRRKCNFFIYDHRSVLFFEEQVNVFSILERTNKLDIIHLHDEDIANSLIWKYQFDRVLPLIDMEEFYDLNFSNLQNYSYHTTDHSPHVKLPKTVDDFLIFHGYKKQEDYDKIKNNYGDSVLNIQDFIITYENNTLFFKKNNFLRNKKIENKVDFNLYDEKFNLIFSLRNQEIYNYWTFYVSDIFLNNLKVNVIVTETDTSRTIYQNTVQL